MRDDPVVPPDHPDGGTKVNHFSFDVYDFEDCEKRIKAVAAGIEYKKVYVPEGDRGINQIFFQDPDDEMIEHVELVRMHALMGNVPSDSSLKSLRLSIDVDNNANISLRKVLRFVRNVCLNTPNEQLAVEIFKAIDTNASGSVTTAEFRKALDGLGVELTDAQAAETFGLVDADGSGTIHSSECSSLTEQFRQHLPHALIPESRTGALSQVLEYRV
ncbi:hypothetical protein B484DRAFT_399142 [Ochromonadaceae sp. CCMP2298]|nr:hypothetical protein B484DRAFT_399142 [Ochromonadaceae sp. CCMP2298]